MLAAPAVWICASSATESARFQTAMSSKSASAVGEPPIWKRLPVVTAGAKVVFGPAPRALPQLELYVDKEGFLRARRDFAEPVGPGWWSRPEESSGGSGG